MNIAPTNFAALISAKKYPIFDGAKTKGRFKTYNTEMDNKPTKTKKKENSYQTYVEFQILYVNKWTGTKELYILNIFLLSSSVKKRRDIFSFYDGEICVHF